MIEAASYRDPNVTILQVYGKTVWLVGTAHVSSQSVELVERIIREERPDAVAVELCASRYEALGDPERWKKTDIVALLREGKGFLLLAQLLLAGYQKRLGDRLQIKPGAEMMQAVSIAKEVGASIVLADRDIRITLKRVWRQLRLRDLMMLIAATIESMFSPPVIEAEDIERLKSADALEEALREFSRALPSVREALIDERDQYLSAKVQSAPGNRIVCVVGAAHVPGMKKYFGTEIDIDKLEEIPPRSVVNTAVTWGLPIVFALLVCLVFIQSGAAGSAELLSSWALVTGIFGALGAALALSHPLSVVVAFFCAPLTPLNPVIKSGRMAALTEAILRKPQVQDFEEISSDISSVRGIYRNRVTRLLLVLSLTALCTWIGIAWGVALILGSVSSIS